jgi:hypothetical protein
MTTPERIRRMLDANVFGADGDFWGRDLVAALFPRLMLAAVIRERSERQKTSGSLYARRFDGCTLCTIEDRARISRNRR